MTMIMMMIQREGSTRNERKPSREDDPQVRKKRGRKEPKREILFFHAQVEAHGVREKGRQKKKKKSVSPVASVTFYPAGHSIS